MILFRWKLSISINWAQYKIGLKLMIRFMQNI